MKRLSPIVIAFSLLASLPCVIAETPLGTDFTFQGQLKVTGNPFISTADFRFSLFDADVGGNQIGTTLLKENTAIVSGLFTLSLDFGAAAFKGNARWIEIAVRGPAGAGGFTTLSPRQLIAVAPNALFSLQTRGITVDAAGKVGIGTTTLSKTLTVAGDMELRTSSLSCPKLSISNGGSNGFLYGSSPTQGDGVHLGYNYFADCLGFDEVVNQNKGTSLLSLNDGQIELATSSPGFAPLSCMAIDQFGVVRIRTPGQATSSKLEVSGTIDTLFVDVQSDLRVFGGEQSFGDSHHLIWRLGDRLFNTAENPELIMISPVTDDELAGFYRDHSSGNGVMFADDKNFRAPNPADAATDIWYCCPEGPEAAMYVRGTARLTNGRAIIELPDHFRNLASEPGMTVQLTPRSLESKGLAIIKASLDGIEVGELANGTGNYEFDWRVEAVRKGYEDYKIVRPWLRSDEDPDKAWQNRLKHIEERRAHGKPSPTVSAATPRPTE